MTVPDAEGVMTGLERRAGTIMTICAVGTIICLVGLIYLQFRINGQAKDGQRAHTTQCEREPVIHKLVLAGAKYRLLTPVDVRSFERTAPNCL